MCVGVWWLMSIFSTKTFPTSASLDRLQQRIQVAADRDEYSTVSTLTSEALRIAPLDWSLYNKRGAAEAALFHAHSATQRDFAAARYLLPYWPNLYFEEGRTWIAVGEPDLGFEVWTEGLRRSREKAPNLYRQMFDVIKSDASLVDLWREIGRANKECLLVFLQNAGPFEFQIELESLLSGDPELRSFSSDQLRALFAAWYQKGDKLELAEILRQHPEWKKNAWRELARTYADYEDYRQAWETAQEFGTPPELPRFNSDEPLEKLKVRFRLERTNLTNGLALYFAQLKQQQTDAALATLRDLIALPRSPQYLWYLESQFWAEKQDWQKAWRARARFEFAER
jgi:hypothetical protein